MENKGYMPAEGKELVLVRIKFLPAYLVNLNVLIFYFTKILPLGNSQASHMLGSLHEFKIYD